MGNRFANKKNINLSSIWQILSLFIVIGFVIFFLRGVSAVDASTAEEQAKSLEDSIRKSVAQCYAVEGTYPPSLDYLKEHYGLFYDTHKYYVDYTAIGSNIMPDITILPKKTTKR